MVSPYGQLSSEVLENVWDVLKEVGVDAENQKLIWSGGARLSIDESVQRIHVEFADFPTDLIEAHLIGWLEQVYEPEVYTQAQMNELDELVDQWVDSHQGLI
ncbi:MAG: hypothetical protein P8Y45_24005 [Exilibacterium sp.]